MTEEYPRWMYAADGTARLIHGPDEKSKGWSDTPPSTYAAGGERIIGDGVKPEARTHTAEVVAPPPAPSPEDHEKTSKKAK